MHSTYVTQPTCKLHFFTLGKPPHVVCYCTADYSTLLLAQDMQLLVAMETNAAGACSVPWLCCHKPTEEHTTDMCDCSDSTAHALLQAPATDQEQ